MLSRSIVPLIIALVTLSNAVAQSRDSFAGVKTLRRAAFVNVNVVDVEQGRILPNQTVFIAGGAGEAFIALSKAITCTFEGRPV